MGSAAHEVGEMDGETGTATGDVEMIVAARDIADIQVQVLCMIALWHKHFGVHYDNGFLFLVCRIHFKLLQLTRDSAINTGTI